jgi:putative hemolysin
VRYLLWFAAIGSMTAYHVLATAPTAVGTGNSSGATGKNHGGSNPALFFCSGLFGGSSSNSGVLESVLSVAPLTAGAADAKSAVQFSQIWSNTHQAAVGQHRDPLSKPLVADVKLPIAFSAADRKRFEEAGWKPRPGAIGPVTSYCLESGGSREAGTAAPARGLFCVTGGP